MWATGFWADGFWASDFWTGDATAATTSDVDQIFIQLPLTKVKERTTFAVTAYFRKRSTSAAIVPATARYRIDCLTTKRVVQNWTDLTAASSIAITVSAANNRILSTVPTASGIGQRFETKQLIVESDADTVTACKSRIAWTVENVFGVPTDN